MRRSEIIIALAGLVIIWCVVVAYLAGTPPPAPATPHLINIGLVPSSGPDRSASFGFLSTSKDAAGYPIDAVNTTSLNEVCYILGRDVDTGGNATSWIFGIRNENRTYLLLYDWTGWTALPWNEELTGDRIDLEGLVSLGGILTDNQNLLAGTSATGRQVEVYNNTYYISVPAGTQSTVYAFNVSTGALIESHED